uniref:Uncharacterized protein n=1 Tax=Rhodosorus marinus TaxID=101924 RepID=A0A7S2ZE56_9RHOD|mmetsp:Transcript_15191/g.62208  ORF Transcript_15191/g.62208 Transcript_15191/m.62208 type:complete len:164 (+) Transcript_15191:59-550(+)
MISSLFLFHNVDLFVQDSMVPRARPASRQVIITNTRGLGTKDLSEMFLAIGGLSQLEERTAMVGRRKLKYYVASFQDTTTSQLAVRLINRKPFLGVKLDAAFHREELGLKGFAMEWQRLKSYGWEELNVVESEVNREVREQEQLEEIDEAIGASTVFNTNGTL